MNLQLPKLLRDNADRPRDFRVVAKGDSAEIYLYDVIGEDFWTGAGITADMFLNAVESIKADTIHLRIDSPGGDVFAARNIVSAMRRSNVRFVAHIDSLAASAASVIAVAADEVLIARGAMMMIHNAWTIATGDHQKMQSTAELLKKIDGTIIADYAEKTGMDKADISALMNAVTWMTDDETVQKGFADAVEPSNKSRPKNRWDLSAYSNAPAPEVVEPITLSVAATAQMASKTFPVEDIVQALHVEPDNTADADHAHRTRMAALAALNPA